MLPCFGCHEYLCNVACVKTSERTTDKRVFLFQCPALEFERDTGHSYKKLNVFFMKSRVLLFEIILSLLCLYGGFSPEFDSAQPHESTN